MAPDRGQLVALGLGNGNYWFTFFSDSVTVLFLLIWESAVLRTNLLLIIIGFAAGLFAWSLLEYCFHRWVYHKGRTPAHAGHKIHHQSPETLIAMPWFVVTALFGGAWYLFALILHLRVAISVEAGLLSGFVFYGVFHHLLHHFNFRNPRYRKLRAHHLIHHHTPNVNFGVTSRFWDHAFRTMHKKTSSAARQISNKL